MKSPKDEGLFDFFIRNKMKVFTLIGQSLALSLLLFLSDVHADGNNFPQPADFSLTRHDARVKNIPIMVLFSSVHCDYCNFIKEEFLNPMIKSGDYLDKVVIKVVEDDEGDEVVDFNKEIIGSGDFSDRYKIIFTPTIVFINSDGVEVTERIVGLGNVEYFGGFLDEAIDNAQIMINSTVVGLTE